MPWLLELKSVVLGLFWSFYGKNNSILEDWGVPAYLSWHKENMYIIMLKMDQNPYFILAISKDF